MYLEMLKREAEYILYDARDHILDTPGRLMNYFGFEENKPSGLTDPLVVGIGGFLHDGASCYRIPAGKLKEHGIKMVGFRDWCLVGDIEEAANVMAADIEAVKAGTDVKRIVLVGHSQGGLIARDIVQRGLLDVDMLFELSAPNHPTPAAGLVLPFKAGRQMFYGSDYLKRLNTRPRFGETKVYNVFSDIDLLVPEESARLDVRGVRNKLFEGRGHSAFLYDDEVIDYVVGEIVKRYGRGRILSKCAKR